MISLLRWGFGNGHEHLTEKERITAVEKRNPHASSTMLPTQVKRKRGDSTHSLTTHSQQRPVKRAPPVIDIRGGGTAPSKSGAANGTAPGSESISHDNVRNNRVTFDSNALVTTINQDVDFTDNSATPPSFHNEPIASASSPSNMVDQTMETPAMPELSAVQQAITEQFNLDILLKHRELRLIEQEIGKCQVALEQLRRCSVIPYPSTTGKVSDLVNVMDGAGLALRPAAGNKAPRRGAPWGIREGPYSRHYAQWLLPDPEFDGGIVEEVSISARGSNTSFSRRQRTSGDLIEPAVRGQTSRGRRGSGTSRFQALSAGYPPPKEDKGLAIVTRQSDKKLVKLVCMDCGRENFNSAQGFINHCRIAHSRFFASHEVAAQSVGVEVDAPPAEPSTAVSAAPAQTPTIARLEPSTPAPLLNGVVHPLLRPDQPVPTLQAPKPRNKSRSLAPASASQASPAPLSTPRVLPPDNYSGVPFKPSSSTPHLSKIFAQSGRGGDLEEFVSDAKKKENLDAMIVDEVDSDSNFEDESAFEPAHGARLPARGGLRTGPASMSPIPSTRPISRKGPDRVSRHVGAMSTPAGNRGDGSSFTHPTTLSLSDTPPNDLSPHTVESNNAPSLVSDSDDDDYESGSGSSGPTSEADDEEDEGSVDVDFEVEDVVRERGGHIEPSVNIPGKSHDPELSTSSKAKVARGGFRGPKNGRVAKNGARK